MSRQKNMLIGLTSLLTSVGIFSGLALPGGCQDITHPFPASAFGTNRPPLPGLSISQPTLPTVNTVSAIPIGSQPIDVDLIRVGISDSSMMNYEYPETKITGLGAFTVIHEPDQAMLLKGEPGEAVSFSVDKSGFWVQREGQSPIGPFPGPIKVQPDGGQLLKVLSITRRGVHPAYRGSMEIVRGGSSPEKLSLINILSLQDYLKAVVPNELPPRFGYEAVKAQAIAARNYAVRPREKNWSQFDICDSQYCQVYFGAETEHAASNQALTETLGLLALYEGDPILALYSSTNSGYSESYENAFPEIKSHHFPGTTLPYLKGAPDLPEVTKVFGDLHSESSLKDFLTRSDVPGFDAESHLYRWHRSWTQKELQVALDRSLQQISDDRTTAPYIFPHYTAYDNIGKIKQIKVLQRGDAGTAMVVEIQSTTGTWRLETQFVIRKAFASLCVNGEHHAWKMLPSANVVFENRADEDGSLLTLDAIGGGFGHGVGMSQYGAGWMSGHGYGFDKILQHYYQGIAIGCKPLEVGQGHASSPVKTRFYSPKEQAKLWIETQNPNMPVRISLNGTVYTFGSQGSRPVTELFPERNSYGGIAQGLPQKFSWIQCMPVALIPGAANTLTLYPDSQLPQQMVKVWVEVFPSQQRDGDLAQKSVKNAVSEYKPEPRIPLP